MYNSKMWLFVKPSIGLPLFFGGVALTSLAVHTAVLKNTTWMPAFYNGKGRPAAASVAPTVTPAAVTLTPATSAQPTATQAAATPASPQLASLEPGTTSPK